MTVDAFTGQADVPVLTPTGQAHGGMIRLANPVADHFKAFIVGNATKCDKVLVQDANLGQELVICGAGTSLRDTAPKWCPTGDQVWGCNSALTWLYNNGHKVTHGFTVDQTPQMVEEWASCPDVEYLLASTCHPHLVDYLAMQGRSITFFHNYVGIKERPVAYPDDDGNTRIMAFEDYLYAALYPGTVRVGAGLNAVTRAIEAGIYLGFKRITVLGADGCLRAKRPSDPKAGFGSPEHMKWLREEVTMHADGGNALASDATATTLEAVIDGRYWISKPDLIISAIWLVWMKRRYGSRLRIMGDTLTKALMDKPDEYLKRLPTMVSSDGKEVTYNQTPDEVTKIERDPLAPPFEAA